MKLVNLTPHAVVYQHDDGTRTTIEASGKVARLRTATEYGYYFTPKPAADYDTESFAGAHPPDAFAVWMTTTGEIENLPEHGSERETVYIVSMPVAQATHRNDVVAPDSGPTCIRENGQIVAVTRFTRYAAAMSLPEAFAQGYYEGSLQSSHMSKEEIGKYAVERIADEIKKRSEQISSSVSGRI